MKWVVIIVVGFVVLAFVGILLGGLAMQKAAQDRMVASGTYPYSPSYSSSGYYGTGPEWDKLKEAQQKGDGGLADVQALMLSSDTSVANEASMYLARRSDEKAFTLFFEQIPKLDPTVKDGLRSAYYESRLVVDAAKRVKSKDAATKEGAQTFINLCYMRDNTGNDDAFKILVSAIPDYKGSEADDLAYTIGLFRPNNVQPLVDMLGSSEARTRKTAVVALGKMGATEALDEVKKMKSDSSASVRTAAATAESSLNAAASYVASSSYSSYTGETDVFSSERSNARKRLGMP